MGKSLFIVLIVHARITIWFREIFLYRYKEARTQLDLIFGPKFHKEFPRKYLESGSCGDGFWESTGKGKYNHPGVDAVSDNMKIGDMVRTIAL